MPFSQPRRAPAADAGGNHHNYHRSAFSRAAAVHGYEAAAVPNLAHYPYRDFPCRNHQDSTFNHVAAYPGAPPPLKRRRSNVSMWDEHAGNRYWNGVAGGNAPSTSHGSFLYPRRRDTGAVPARTKAEPAKVEDAAFMSRDEIERCSPSRKDGIDPVLETQLRYSYCSYLHSLGLRLELPQTTIGTAIVLCHRFFLRRSHACHDRFLIATAALFLAAKSEETPCLLNSVLRASCEISQKQEFVFFPYLLHNQDWFEQYREKVIEAEQIILTTLDFELDVQHPYAPLTSVLNKLGLSQNVLFNMAWNLISEGLRSSLWLQFKSHHIAAGAAFLAARFINYDLAFLPSFWHEFQTTPSILQDVVQQLMELF